MSLAEAVVSFRKVVELEPNNPKAHLYLGTALMWHWGKTHDPALAASAEAEFRRALDFDSRDTMALWSLANLAYWQSLNIEDVTVQNAKLTESADWHRRLIAVNPNDKDALYAVGAIAWRQAFQPIMTSRRENGMKPEDAGPLKNVRAREALQARYLSSIADGMSHLERALRIDPDYDDAMAYMNLLMRLRADLSDTEEEYARDTALADEWVRRALEVKKRKGTAVHFGPSGSITFNPVAPGSTVGETSILRRYPIIPPPPPPPPPFPEAARSNQGVQRIRIGGGVQAANLTKTVAPVYPELARQARIQGSVKMSVIIDQDGDVSNVQLVSGHPLLVDAAREAVKQWRYRPTLLNGQPVEVITQVDVNFVLPPN